MKLQVTNPLNGSKEDLASVQSWVQNILGVLFLFVVFATGQKVAKTVEAKTKFDTSPEFTVNTPTQASRGPQINTY